MSTPLSTAYQNKIAALTNGQRAACLDTLAAANIGFERDGALDLYVSNDNATAQTIIDTPIMWLAAAKVRKQAALDDILDTRFDFKAFIRGGTIKTITGTQVGNFIATFENNWRTLRDAIAAAATTDAVIAINVESGWPANP